MCMHGCVWRLDTVVLSYQGKDTCCCLGGRAVNDATSVVVMGALTALPPRTGAGVLTISEAPCICRATQQYGAVCGCIAADGG
jgi:hypothetical protein